MHPAQQSLKQFNSSREEVSRLSSQMGELTVKQASQLAQHPQFPQFKESIQQMLDATQTQ